MLTTKTNSSLISVRLGGLLISAGFIRPDHMAAALAEARKFNLKLGELLVAANLVSDADLACALEIQNLIKDGSLTVDMGTQALKQTRQHKCGVHFALVFLGYKEAEAIKPADLTSILLEAGAITKAQVEQARWNAAKNLLPPGRNLVLAGAVSPSLLGSALNALVLLRGDSVSRQDAVDALRACHQHKSPLEKHLWQAAMVPLNHVRVGELLSSAGLLSESDAMIAVENGLLNQKSIGQSLLEANMISPLVLNGCVELQKMIQSGAVSKVQATELLRQIATKQVGLADCLSEMSYLKSRMLELLVRSGLVTEEHLQTAIQHSPELQNDPIKALLFHEVITQEMFRNCVRCIYAIDAGSQSINSMIDWLRSEYSGLVQQSA